MVDKEKDLILGQESEDDEDSGEDGIYIEESSPMEYIAAAYNAIGAIDGMDSGIMSKADARRIERIKRKSLRLIDHFVNVMHATVFEETKQDEE